jgi:hypothetical protein
MRRRIIDIKRQLQSPVTGLAAVISTRLWSLLLLWLLIICSRFTSLLRVRSINVDTTPAT